jgi:hypothetical protein
MIYFGFLFIMLFHLYDLRIVFKGLIRVDLAHFLYNFLIKIFTNLIVQQWILYRRLTIKLL